MELSCAPRLAFSALSPFFVASGSAAHQPRPRPRRSRRSRRIRGSRRAKWSMPVIIFLAACCGGGSRELAQIGERAGSQWGLPNGFILGQYGGGAGVAGLRYGEGTLYTKNAGDLKVYWQGPSLGWDAGGEVARTMMLVYNLPASEAI